MAITGSGSGLSYEPDAGYCNEPGLEPTDGFTYTLNGGSDATVSVTVNCLDTPPSAVDDAATVSEGAAATAIDVLANDSDPDGGPKSVASVTQPANGTVAITGSGSGLSYEPDAGYCNEPGLEPTDGFTYTLNGGSDATVSVTVNCLDTPPSAVDDAATVNRNTKPTTINVLANDTDPDGGPMRIVLASDPAHGTVTLATNTKNTLKYAPDKGYCNTSPATTPRDTFTYTLNGGSTATVSMTVRCP